MSELAAALITAFLFLILGYDNLSAGRVARDAIVACEKNLPRSQRCEITAKPVSAAPTSTGDKP